MRFKSPRFDEGTRKRMNRRRMAWTSLISMLVIVFLLMFFVQETRIVELTPVIDTVIFCLSSIVGAYLGTALLDDKNIMTIQSEEVKAAKVVPVVKSKITEDDSEEELPKTQIKK